VDDVLGIDLGTENIATDSDGNQYSEAKVDERRQWYEERRAILQSVGTPSAKRRLQQLGGKQSRFQSDTNHCIAKEIVECVKDTDRAIALEDLTGIPDGTTVRRSQRSRHSNWSFYDLRKKIE
jgi:IS605 OrfB family transposase